MTTLARTRAYSAIREASWEIGGVGAATLLLLAYALNAPSLAVPVAAVALIAGILGSAAWITACLCGALFVFGVAAQPLNELAVDAGIKIYVADAILACLILGSLLRTATSTEKARTSLPVPYKLALLVVVLLFSAIHGLVAHNEIHAVLGDVRRMILYPSALFVVFYALETWHDGNRLLTAIVVAGFGVAGTAIFRIVTGIGVLQGGEGEMTIRYLSFLEASTAGVAILILVGRARMAGSTERWLNLLLAVPLLGAVLFSNYRTAWVALALGLGTQAAALGWRRAVRALLLGSLLVVPIIAVLLLATSLRETVLARLDVRDLFRSGTWRLFSWYRAYQVWRAHPILGTGMGYVHQFSWFKFETGEMVAENGRAIHNDALWFLVNNGLLGILAAALVAVSWLRRAVRLAGSRELHSRFLGSTAVGALVLLVMNAMLQPFFSFAGETLIAAIFIALVLRFSGRDNEVARVSA